MATENPAQTSVLKGQEGKHFIVQLNDGFVKRGCEDDLALGTVHPRMTLEFIYWLRRLDYQGHIYFDTFLINEDPVREAEHNIRLYKKWRKFASVIDENGIEELLIKKDKMAILELLEGQ